MRKSRNHLKPARSSQVQGATATRLAATEARNSLSEVLLRVFKGERIVLQRHGRDLAALIPMEDCEWLEKLEDLLDIADAKRVLAEGGRPITLETLRRRLGLVTGEVSRPNRAQRSPGSPRTTRKASRATRRADHRTRAGT
jgi:prevent-host-death family protein